MTELQNLVKQYMEYDNTYNELNQQLKDIKENKNIIENQIIEIIKDKNYNNIKIETSDSIIKFNDNITTSGLTFRYLEECLNLLIKDKNKIKEYIDFIKNNRTSKSEINIKRTLKK